MADITNSVVVVTGGNRGIGKALVAEALARGAAKVYATARAPFTASDPRVVPIVADVTEQASVDALASIAQDATIVISNAGIGAMKGFLESSIDEVQAVFDTNFTGSVRVAQAFAPVLAANGGGALVNVASILSWLPGSGAYGASKAALWSLSGSLRVELAGQGTQVVSAHLGYTDTDMTAGIDAPKNTPESVAAGILDAVQAGAPEALVDDLTRQVRAGLGAPLAA